MAKFRLKLREAELDLPNGELSIGRGTDCFLRINDELVSRRHARLLVTPNSVFLDDLGSRNGSRVNGSPLTGSIELKIGDEVEIGTQIFQLVQGASKSPRMPTATTPNLHPCRSCKRLMRARVSICPLCGANQRSDDHDDGPTRSMTSFELLLGVGDKMLALGRTDEAEKMLRPRLRELLLRAGKGDLPGFAEVTEALRRGVRLATATQHAEWYVWIFDFARLASHPIEEPLLDELHAQMLAHKPPAETALKAYLDAQTAGDEATLAHRGRIEALLRFCQSPSA